MTMTGGLEASEVVVAGTQHIYVAPPGSEVPDEIDDDLDSPPWYDLGYTTEDGIALSFGKDTDTVMSSQTLDPLRMLVTAAPKTITASLRQLNRETLRLALGGGDVSGDRKWKFTPASASFIDIRMVAIEAEDGAKRYRFIYYRAMVSEAVEFSFVNTAGVVLPLTFSVLANEPYTFELQADEGDEDAGSGNPSLASVTPNHGDAGDNVALAGTNFASGMTVQFAGAAATNVVVASPTSATCVVPGGTGAVTVAVTVAGKPAASLPNGFTYDEP